MIDYPDPKSASKHRWAWEFLRRNPEFERDMLEWMRYEKEHPIPRSGPIEERFRSPTYRRMKALKKKWGIDYTPLAEWGLKDNSPRFEIDGHVGTFTLAGDPEKREYWLEPYSKTRAVWLFDLTKPIAPQLRNAKQHVETERSALAKSGKTVVRERRARDGRRLLLYLQLLDADEDGMLIAAMAKKFFPKEIDSMDTDYRVSKKVRKQLQSARDVRDGGYRLFPLLMRK